METVRMAVIGAGPSGIAVGVEAARARITGTILLEKADHPCDTIVSLYRAGKRVDSVYRKVAVPAQGALSFQSHTKESFLEWMAEVIRDYELDIRYSHEILEVKREENGFLVYGGDVPAIKADIVVIAIGIFGKPVKPSYPIPREVQKRIFFSIPDSPLTGKDLLVVGGGDSAAEAACFLSRLNRVTLSYRRSGFFRINEPNLCTLNQCCNFENLETRLGQDITGIVQDGERIGVMYQDGKKISYDAIFYFLGGSTPKAFLEKAGVCYSEGKPSVDQYGETNIPGLFLVGDLAANKGTIMTAFNSAAAAVGRISSTLSHLTC